ncbi:MAG: hypothetical protein FJ255_01705 [Phycisphaerae bacterium]|nr:hypothetical protein [Phycisphaerae bacterium]
MVRFSRHDRLIVGFTLLYLVGLTARSVGQGNTEFLYYAAVMLGLIGAVGLLHARVRLPAGVLAALSAWGLLHMLGGTLAIPASVSDPPDPAVLYNLRLHRVLPKFDQLVHAYGFGVATWASYHALRHAMGVAGGGRFRVTLGTGTALVCMGMGLGALNEVVEFAATRLMPRTNVGGYENTGWDLVSNLAGCLIAVAGLALRQPPYRSAP